MVAIQCMAVAWHALTLRSKGQGHTAIECTASMGMQVERLLVLMKFIRIRLSRTNHHHLACSMDNVIPTSALHACQFCAPMIGSCQTNVGWSNIEFNSVRSQVWWGQPHLRFQSIDKAATLDMRARLWSIDDQPMWCGRRTWDSGTDDGCEWWLVGTSADSPVKMRQ